MRSWVVKVKSAHHAGLWVLGNIEEAPGDSRAQIKAKAVALVKKRFFLDECKIVGIARGYLALKLEGDWLDFDTWEAQTAQGQDLNPICAASIQAHKGS
jgi:hypothetical protein